MSISGNYKPFGWGNELQLHNRIGDHWGMWGENHRIKMPECRRLSPAWKKLQTGPHYRLPAGKPVWDNNTPDPFSGEFRSMRGVRYPRDGSVSGR